MQRRLLLAILIAPGLAHADPPRAAKTRETMPVADVLEDLSSKAGYAFIADSRLLDGREIEPIARRRPSPRHLRRRLAAVDLDLHQLNATTFALSAMVSPPSAPHGKPLLSASTVGIETIIVTGTAVAGLSYANVVEIDPELLQLLAASSTADAAYQLPLSLASITAANTSLLGTTAGLNLIDLRGLGTNRSLVLVNGSRRTLFAGGNGTIAGVDLNSIAAPFLERVEVTAASAGALLDPDAVAGAVNFVTRRDVEGVEIGGRYGLTEKGDGEEYGAYVLAGSRSADGARRVVAGLSFESEDGLLGADRTETATPYGFAVDGRMGFGENAVFAPGFGGSTVTPAGTIAGAVGPTGEFIPGVALSLDGAGGAEPYEGRLDQLYNWAGDTALVLPNERALALLDGSMDVAPSIELGLFVQAGWSQTDLQLAPVPATVFQGADPQLGGAIPIPINHPTLTDDIRTLVFDQYGPDVAAVAISRRFTEVGPRRRETDRWYLDAELSLGFEAGPRSADISYRYGRNLADTEERNRISRANLLLTVDEAACASAPGCVTTDFFTAGGVSAAVADFVRADPERRRVRVEEHELRATAGYENAAGALRIGAVARRTRLDDRSDDAQPVLGSFNGTSFDATLDRAELFLNLSADSVPLGPFGEAGAFFGARASAVSEIPPFTNIQGAADWRPVPALKLFVDAHAGSRPPNIWELYTRGQFASRFYADPCAFSSDAVVAANCAVGGPLGTPDGYQQSAFIVETTFVGNPDLDAEEVVAFSAGAETDFVEPAFLPGRLRVSAAWRDFHVRGAIDGLAEPLEECYFSEDLSSPACGTSTLTGAPLIQRDPATGDLLSVTSTLRNGGHFEWRGLDAEAQYQLDLRGGALVDRIWASGYHTYTDDVRIVSAGGLVFDAEGTMEYPRHRSLFAVGAARGPISLSTLFNRRGRVEDERFPAGTGDADAVIWTDVSLRADIGSGLGFVATLENATDEPAPIVANGESFVQAQHYDLFGRRFLFSVVARL
ncbi:MAG: TonB-dependent receptor [Pseudomonadota bacterium]